MGIKNKYEITIDLNNKEEKDIFIGHIGYIGSTTLTDDLKIFHNRITIISQRNSKINLEEIFYNHNSSLYNQIIKALAYYYCIIGKYIEINTISISRSRSLKQLDSKVLKKSEINQIINSNFKLNYSLHPDKLEIIFKESEKGKMILNSITHLIKANNSNDENERFDRLWKSFNPLYRLIGKEPTEYKCLKKTRQFMILNQICFNYSLPIATQINASDLRRSLRWRAMILNNHPLESDTPGFKDSIIRYSDSRIMNIYNDLIGIREQYLKNNGLYILVMDHINKNINLGTKVHIEILSILTLRYMYFVRNKSFHGEKIDSTFRLTINKEITEYRWLNKIFEPFVFDLINSNDKY